jgi:mitogen-activated protein kinase 1/3
VSGTSFRVHASFSPLGIVGKGSYGVVCAARSEEDGGKVAIKSEPAAERRASQSQSQSPRSPAPKLTRAEARPRRSSPFICARCARFARLEISPMCSDVWDAKHTLRELRLMRLMEHHPNVISLRDLTLVEAADELYIVMELMDADLHKIITSKQALSKPHMQVIVSQILRGVNALHDNDVFHRDLKPGNILVGRDCQIRITDFGLARSLPPSTANSATALDAEETPSAMTEYVVTRWYRCPELLLAPHCAYTSAVDLWSVGCIVAEMVGRAPLFPGRSYVHQVQLILDAIGTPPSDAEMGFEPRADARAYLSRQQAKPGRPWPALLPGADPEVLDLIGCLLVFNPKKRQTAKEAMEVSKSGERRELRAK